MILAKLSQRIVLALACSMTLVAPVMASSIASGPWPSSSDLPVAPLPHPSLQEHLHALGDRIERGFRIAVYGDQRALAEGEWQAMAALIAHRETDSESPTPFIGVLDTGDIVFDGSHSDQFHMFMEIVEPLREWPYLVGIGNHEVNANKPGPARRHVVDLLRTSLGGDLSVARMYYRRDIGPLRVLFLDSNDFIYGPQHELEAPGFETVRGRAQLSWLSAELASPHDGPTAVVLHHPFLISSRKHEKHAAALWSLRHQGRTLAEMFIDGRVELVLTGHTHTYERFRVANDRGGFDFINVSGRPKSDFLGYGDGKRRARDIQGREIEVLGDRGWRDLEGWSITQVEAMTDDEANQWMELRVGADGELQAEMFYLVDKGKKGARPGGAFMLGR